MEHVYVSSSNLRSVGYDRSSMTLEIAFNSGSLYAYHGVPGDVYAGLLSAGSKGTYHHNFIKNSYPYTRIR